MSENKKKRGVYGKYQIEKTDGSRLDPEAVYFTLRLDSDPHARLAILAYIASVADENKVLAHDLLVLINELDGVDPVMQISTDRLIFDFTCLFHRERNMIRASQLQFP